MGQLAIWGMKKMILDFSPSTVVDLPKLSLWFRRSIFLRKWGTVLPKAFLRLLRLCLSLHATYPKKPNKKLPSKILSFGSEKLSKAKDLYFPYFYTLGNSLIFVLKLDFGSVWFFSIHSTLSMKKI